MKKLFLLLVASTMLCSCATLFTGLKTKVTFDSEVQQPVSLTVDGVKVGTVTLPYTMKVKGGFNETIVKAETQGYKPYVLIIDKDFNPVSVLNLFGLLGWGIDAATGAMMKPEYKFYEFYFVPQSSVQEEAK